MRRPFVTSLCLALAHAACSDALEQNTTSGQSIAVLDSGSLTVSFVSANDLATTPIPLGGSGSTPSTLAARGAVVLVPLGGADAVQRATPLGAGPLLALAVGADPSGVAVQNDTVAWVSATGLDEVVRVHLDSGAGTGLATGPVPGAALFAAADLLYVLNRGSGPPYPAGSISWFRLGTAPASGTIALSVTRPVAAALGEDGFVYVVGAGDPGEANGRLSIVDPATNSEVAVLNGLGESPRAAVYHPSGRLLIASLAEGILEVAAATRRLVRGPGQGVMPGGEGVSAIAVDARGRLYAAAPGGCVGPGVLYVLTAPPDYGLLETVPVGVCPTAAALVAAPELP